jgi:hypothetical protein
MACWMLVTTQAQKVNGKLPRSLPTLSNIEDALTSAQVMDSGSDFQYWLKLYARKLSDESELCKATEICHLLLDRKSCLVEVILFINVRELIKFSCLRRLCQFLLRIVLSNDCWYLVMN